MLNQQMKACGDLTFSIQYFFLPSVFLLKIKQKQFKRL